MDGRKKRTTYSLTFELSLWIACTIIVIGLLASILSFNFAYQEVNALQDGQLQDIGELIDSYNLPPTKWIDSNDQNINIKVVIESLTANTKDETNKIVFFKNPETILDGLHDVHSNGETWRVNIHTLHTGQRIAIAQNTAIRDEIAMDSALRTLIPMLCLLPTLIVMITIFIRMLFAPIIRLSAIVDRQNEMNMEALSDERIALEMRPFIDSINRLIKRVKESIVHQHQFIAHASHELRSPLTALSLQAENLERAQMSFDAVERLRILRAGLNRAKQLVEQLLTLAKLQSNNTMPVQSILLPELVAGVIGEIIAKAEQKYIDIGSTRLDDLEIMSDQNALYIVLRNLVDNAVRYTSRNGTVDVSAYVNEGKLFFEVQDSGPGIPPVEIEKVFTPFYRARDAKETGSGLGLAIVLETTKRMGGKIVLENLAIGFRATYSQPLA